MSESTNGHSNGDGHAAEAVPAPVPTPKLSAAQQLQQAHEAQANGVAAADAAASAASADAFPALGGSSSSSVDPFPVATYETPAAAPAPPKPINIQDESAFPSLSMTANPKKAGPTWGSGGGAAAQRIKLGAPTPTSSNGASRAATPTPAATVDDTVQANGAYSTRVQLNAHEIHVQAPAGPAGRGRGVFSNERAQEPTTLGEVMTLLKKRHPTVQIDASTSKNLTTFLIRSKGPDAQPAVEQVKRELLGRLAKKVNIDVLIPAGLRALIIGSKGASPTLAAVHGSGGEAVG